MTEARGVPNFRKIISHVPCQCYSEPDVLKKRFKKRFLSLRNTPAHCIAFVVNPSPEYDRLSFISAEEHAVIVFYCPGPRPPRGGTSLEKLLPLIHPLDDHLAVHVAHINRVNAWAWLLEH